MKILRGGGLRKFLDTQKGGSEKMMAVPVIFSTRWPL